MDSPVVTVLIAAASFAVGLALCWLLMRGRSAAPAPQAHSKAQAELAQAQARLRQLEEQRQMAVKNYEDLKHQTARDRDLGNAMKKGTPPPAANDAAQIALLQAQIATLQAQDQAMRTDAAKAKAQALAEQAQARDYVQALEKNQQLAAARAQALQTEADKLREALDAAHKEQAALRGAQGQNNENAQALERAQARVQALEQENAALKRSAGAPAQSTQLPVLEEQVLALQNLEKSIKKEFELLAELQRNVTLTAATRHEFNDSPESKAGSSTTA